MAQFTIPAAPTVYSRVYDGFKGVDLTTDPLKISPSRAATALNMISDSGGNPEKRVGWRVLQRLGGKVNGLHPIVLGQTQYIVIHAGTTLYLYDAAADSAPTVLRENIHDGVSGAFAMDSKLYVLTGGEYLCVLADDSGVVCRDATEDAYIPKTTIAIPMGDTGGGESFESVNLLQAKRINLFTGDGSSTKARLDVTDIDAIVSVTVNGSAVTDYTADPAAGTVTFKTAPGKPDVSGRDNVEIVFSKATAGNADKVKKCTVCTTYMDGYAFIAGNPEHPNTDWRCGYDDPTYWPDLNYHKIGNEETAIMGYLHVGSRLAILKAPSTQEPSLYFRDRQYQSDNESIYFTVSQGAGGVGAVSRDMVSLLGDPMFLSASGIYGIAASVITSADLLENRSHYIDRELARHDLSRACMTTWRGYLIAAVDGYAFILDGNQQKSWKSKDGGSYVYECYTWDNIPAVRLLSIGDTLYFGTDDGRLCRFNNDIVDSQGYMLMRAYNDDGKAIRAVWATLADDDGYIGQYKTMLKRGCSVTIKPFSRSSVQISVQTEKDAGRDIRYQTMDILSWEDIDFERFAFVGVESPQTVMLNTKVKKYLTAQIIAKNDVLNEAFGIYKIEKRFTKGNYSKR